ncbi:laminin subunit alpha-1-like [Sinocyclocheilus rhinocerous]|uniref:laminin subunit alpha-1-like n=1 Tax=Sinocyclocheilus rhinocerous TaxID=307959 RepID=UPI0007B9D51A|nr:PREDICTED: laminin subunit alpha-1-like [Sinocyclocheilus rhinocerous]
MVCVVGSQVEHRDGVLLRSLQSSSIFTSLVSDDNLIVSNVSASAGVLSVWSWAAPESFLNNKGCAHNTTGPHCDQCLPGFYGDANEGTPDDCQRCSCPLTLASNNFSPTCVLQRAGEFTCDQCQLGYAGAKCERCADGYYGDPAEPGQRCLACECNGNVDPAEAGHCDGRSGECLKCLGHTAGLHCERCADGFYGDAVTLKNCQACGCHGDGSLSTVCHVITGQCECKAHVIGQTCGRCQAGYYGISSGNGCRLCECNQSGALSASCDEEGRCQCITGVTGDKCDRCERGYYSFTESGCTRKDSRHVLMFMTCTDAQ